MQLLIIRNLFFDYSYSGLKLRLLYMYLHFYNKVKNLFFIKTNIILVEINKLIECIHLLITFAFCKLNKKNMMNANAN